jgi:hypothetical protein
MTRTHAHFTKILRVAQGHLAPGMSLDRLNSILAAHGAANSNLDSLPETTLDAIIADISAVVKAAPMPIQPTRVEEVQP